MISTTSAKSVALGASVLGLGSTHNLDLPEDVDVGKDDDRLAEEAVGEVMHGESPGPTMSEGLLCPMRDTLGRSKALRGAGRCVAVRAVGPGLALARFG